MCPASKFSVTKSSVILVASQLLPLELAMTTLRWSRSLSKLQFKELAARDPKRRKLRNMDFDRVVINAMGRQDRYFYLCWANKINSRPWKNRKVRQSSARIVSTALILLRGASKHWKNKGCSLKLSLLIVTKFLIRKRQKFNFLKSSFKRCKTT